MFPEAQAPRGEADRFARFCIVGGIGFVTDAGIMTLCIHGLGWSPTGARALSFAVAVLITFLLNRSISFSDRSGRPILPALISYLLVQAFGFACNMMVFTLAIVRLPAPFSTPLAALALASAVALVLNYAGARFLVFSRTRLPLAGRPACGAAMRRRLDGPISRHGAWMTARGRFFCRIYRFNPSQPESLPDAERESLRRI